MSSSIRMDCILVDSRGFLLEVQRKRVPLVSGGGASAVIPESVFLGLVHALRHQRPDKRRFQLADMMTFFVPAASSAGASSAGAASACAACAKMQTLPPIPCDVVVPTTLPIFHGINRIWLIFREEVLVATGLASTANKKPLAVSILKNGATKSNNNKRVRISQELPRYKELRKPRKTIKIH